MATTLAEGHVGFDGGQVLALRVADEQLEALNGARERAAGTSSSARTAVRFDLGQVAYVRVDSDEPRVGFGA